MMLVLDSTSYNDVQSREKIIHQKEQSLVEIISKTISQFIVDRMQQNNINEDFLSQRDNEFYVQSSHHHHFPYQHENHSLSPQQSSTSDVDETSTSIPKINHSVSNKVIKKKKPTKKKRKDPNEPQKPVSPYALFFRDTQNDIKKKLSNPTFGEISKVVAHMWENIDPEVKEQYKRKAAAAKKEYLKQLAAYRAVQISHQTPNMHHLLNQTSLSFNPHSIQYQQKPYHTTGPMITNHQHQHQQFCSSSSSIQPYNNFHYINPYSQDNSNIYHSNHPHPTYSSYDSNNNYSDYQQYNLLRPVIESEHYSSYYSPPQTSMDNEHIKINENLLHNLNHSTTHYTDLNSLTNVQSDKHYYHHHHGLNEKKEDEHSSLIPISNENHFHWNQTTCLTTEW